MSSTEISHIDCHPDRCSGMPCIAGTRIRVWDVHLWHDLWGWSPPEIISQFPQLQLADVYAALAYYHDHRQEIEQQIQELEDWVSQLKAAQGPTKLDQFRAQGGGDASISPG